MKKPWQSRKVVGDECLIFHRSIVKGSRGIIVVTSIRGIHIFAKNVGACGEESNLPSTVELPCVDDPLMNWHHPMRSEFTTFVVNQGQKYPHHNIPPVKQEPTEESKRYARGAKNGIKR